MQGVFFRASTKEKADELGLAGFVKNLPSGDVECVAEGEKEKLELLLQWAKKGPPGAVVEKIDSEWGKAGGEFSGFKVAW